VTSETRDEASSGGRPGGRPAAREGQAGGRLADGERRPAGGRSTSPARHMRAGQAGGEGLGTESN
jgi:hypothetical protein